MYGKGDEYIITGSGRLVKKNREGGKQGLHVVDASLILSLRQLVNKHEHPNASGKSSSKNNNDRS